MFFGLWAALVVASSPPGQALVKLALDSTVQQEIGEEIRTLHLRRVRDAAPAVLGGGRAGRACAMSLTYSGVAGLTVAAAGLAAARSSCWPCAGTGGSWQAAAAPSRVAVNAERAAAACGWARRPAQAPIGSGVDVGGYRAQDGGDLLGVPASGCLPRR